MNLGRQDWKVDQTCIPLEENRIIFITNINVPVRYLSDETNLDRINRFIESEYRNIPKVYIQFTATYSLESIKTGHQREWVGNFFPRNNNRYSITPFFEAHNFMTKAREYLKEEVILNALSLPEEEETEWAITELHSVIINIQGKTNSDNQTVQIRGLRVGRHGRNKRNHISYAFPQTV